MSHPGLEWTVNYMLPLVGAKIVGTGAFVQEGEAWPYFDVQLEDGGPIYRIEVSRDEEGNGPGFLFGLPVPEKE